MLFKNARLRREEEIRQLKADAMKKAGIAFVAGSAIATLITLFTTPKTGREMRQDVAQKVETGADKVKEKGEFLVIKTAEVLDSTLEKGKNVKSKVSSKFAKNAKQSIDVAEDTAEDIVEDVADAAEEAVEKVEEA